MTRLKMLCKCLFVMILYSGCATTQYEEFGQPPEQAIMQNVANERMPVLEQRLRDLEERVGRIEAELVNRFTGLETAQGDLATRVMALAEQLEALSMQVQNQTTPANASQPPAKPQKTMSMPTVSLERLYEQAVSAYYDRKYDSAQAMFEQIMADYPSSNLADNAQYWIGECLYGLKQYQAALDAFHKVFQYNKTEKDDDAQFMLGQCYYYMGSLDSALVEFNRLKIDHPESEYLGRAEAYIRRIRAALNAGP